MVIQEMKFYCLWSNYWFIEVLTIQSAIRGGTRLFIGTRYCVNPNSCNTVYVPSKSILQVNAYFDCLETTLQETGLSEYLALYFRMDETGFAYDPKPSKTIHLCG